MTPIIEPHHRRYLEEGFVRIRARVREQTGWGNEWVWGAPKGDGLFEVVNVPLAAEGISCGDIIMARPAPQFGEGHFRMEQLVEKKFHRMNIFLDGFEEYGTTEKFEHFMSILKEHNIRAIPVAPGHFLASVPLVIDKDTMEDIAEIACEGKRFTSEIIAN